MCDTYSRYLHGWLQSYISTWSYAERVQVKSIAHCCSKTLMDRTVFLARRPKSQQAMIYGLTTCKNTFGCPICTPMRMAKFRSKIGVLLDALRDKYYAFMVTFTIPHAAYQSCKEVSDILYNTWRLFNLQKGAHKFKKDGTPKYDSIVNEWWIKSQIKYNVRGYEYTWSRQNGWHAHFHCLFWVPRYLVDVAFSFEQELQNYWDKIAKLKTLQYWQKNKLYGTDEQRQKRLEALFWTTRKKRHSGLLISKHEAKSSEYIASWGKDLELTGGNYKQHKNGNLSPEQILEKAPNDNFFAELYKEYLLNVTRKPVHQRMSFSPGMNKIAVTYMNTQKYKEVIKKNISQKEDWEIVGWLSAEDWLKCYELNFSCPFISNMLWLAGHAPNLLSGFLAAQGISLHFSQHLFQKDVLKQMNHSA